MQFNDVFTQTTFIKIVNMDTNDLVENIKHQFRKIFDDICDELDTYELENKINRIVDNWMSTRCNEGNLDADEIGKIFDNVCIGILENVPSVITYDTAHENICKNEGVCIALTYLT